MESRQSPGRATTFGGCGRQRLGQERKPRPRPACTPSLALKQPHWEKDKGLGGSYADSQSIQSY